MATRTALLLAALASFVLSAGEGAAGLRSGGAVRVLARRAPRAAGEESPWEARVPRLEDPRAQLAHARRLKGTMYRRPEEDRPFWRDLAVEAYQAVRHYHPQARALGAEASFRAGELLRAAGAEDRALEEFRLCAELGDGTPFRSRARLEIGHLRRRAGSLRAALDAYLVVASDPGAPGEHRDDAWLWAGRVWQAEGRIDDARRAWRGVAERGADPLDRVLAYDYLGLSWLDEGDPEAAAGILDECRHSLSDVALEETRTGERVRNALLRMRLVEALKREVAEREGSRNTSRRPRKP